MDEAAFWTLREAPLHAHGPDDWARYYPAMAAWLDHDDPQIRAEAVERLCMAVFRAEPKWDRDAATLARTRGRTEWLLSMLEAAHARHPDIIPIALAQLRWHGDDEPFPELLLPWLADLDARPRPKVRVEQVEGARVLIGGLDATEATALLDHASDHVRSCAAYVLGANGFSDPGAFDAAFIDDLTARELARPGIAGPFWSGWSLSRYTGLAFDPLVWMLDIIERRAGPEPDDMAFNGIDFHVHELADFSQDAVRRLLAAGRKDLALMAATETRGIVEGMGEILHAFGDDPDPTIAHEAQDHLAQYYGELHPRADPARLRHAPDWRPGLDAFVMRQGTAETWRDVAALFSTGAPLDDAEACAALDAILPQSIRGGMVEHPLASAGSGPAPVAFGDGEHLAYATGALVTLQGDPTARRWRRLEIIGRGLQGRWSPLELVAGG